MAPGMGDSQAAGGLGSAGALGSGFPLGPILGHGLGRQAPLTVRCTIEETLLLQGLLEIGQGASVRSGFVAELPRK